MSDTMDAKSHLRNLKRMLEKQKSAGRIDNLRTRGMSPKANVRGASVVEVTPNGWINRYLTIKKKR